MRKSRHVFTCHKEEKDGKEHLCWSIVENVRVGRSVFHRQTLYLGKLNDSQREKWQKAVRVLDEDGRPCELKFFPEGRAPKTEYGDVVRIRMDRLIVRNLRNCGEIWLGRIFWDMFRLDGFWPGRIPSSRRRTDWLAIIKTIGLYRFTDSGSELQVDSNWMSNTEIEELVGPGALTGRSTLYNFLNRVMLSSAETWSSST